ncbi:heparanase-like, partial [Asbolus verrucosus]
FTKKIHIVYIEPTEPISVVSDKFLSIALDTSVIANGFKHLNLTDRKMLKVVKALSPAYLRIGGTMADRLIFTKSQLNSFKHYLKGELDGGECSYERKFCDFLQKPNFTMSSREWLQLNKLARETNMEIIFDLNALRRFDNGTWDYRNAEELISFSNEHNLEVNWELGNEPNSFRREFNYDVDPRQLGRDFHTLSNILKKYPKYAKSLLVGPDTTRPEIGHNESEIYLKKFLVDGGDVIDAVTWHHYYFNGATAKIADFLNPKNFDILKWQIVTVKEIVEHDKLTNKPIWLGETSSAYGGGAPHLSNRFIASFLWLDKLGLAAKYGLGVVIRQSIIQGYYALIGYNYNPT